MNPFYHSSTPLVPGSLHNLSYEHDNCGMGAIAHMEGKRSFSVVDYALTSVSCMTHRGAVDADMKTGDGSGVLSQIPYPLFVKAASGSRNHDRQAGGSGRRRFLFSVRK